MYSTIYSTELANAIDFAIQNEVTDTELAFTEECVFTNRKTPAEYIRDNDDIKLSNPVVVRTAKDEIAKLYRNLCENKISRIEYCKQVRIWSDALATANKTATYTFTIAK